MQFEDQRIVEIDPNTDDDSSSTSCIGENTSDTFSLFSPPLQRHIKSTTNNNSNSNNNGNHHNSSTLTVRKRAYDQYCSRLSRRLCEVWGAEEPYTPTGEDNATWPQRLYYTWIADTIYIAANEKLRVDLLLPPRRTHRAHECGLKLSVETHRSLQRRHAWDVLIGTAVGSRDDKNSRGTLRWVGVPKSSGYSGILTAVAWSIPPQQRVAQCTADYSPFFRGILHGETLFTPESTDNTTLEEPHSLVLLLPNGSADAAMAASLPLPRRLSVVRDLLVALPGAVLWQIPGKVIGDICTLTVPLLLQHYVTYLVKENSTWGQGFLLVAGLFFVLAIQSAALHMFYHLGIVGGLCYRSALSAVIFEKCFTISSKSLAIPEMSIGRIINMISSDVERANDFLQYCMYLWSSPMVFILSIVLLYQLVGWCALIGVAALGATLPLNAWVMRRMMVLRQKLVKVTDARVKATNEFFSGIRIAKYMTWEPCFIAEIESKRDTELYYLKEVQKCRVLVSFLNNATPPLMIAIVFVLYHFLGHELTPEVVFPAISLLSIIRMPFIMIPMTFNLGVQFIVSMTRISDFLECENSVESVGNINTYNPSHRKGAATWCEAAAVFENTDITAFAPVKLPRAPKFVMSLPAKLLRRFCCCSACLPEEHRPSPTAVVLEDEEQSLAKQAKVSTSENTISLDVADAGKKSKYDNNNKMEKASRYRKLVNDRFQLLPKKILTDVSVEIPKDKLTIVFGPTGSGKTTLLSALLGDYEVTHGRVWATRSIAYVPQQPWIMNATVRENILFFAPEDSKRLQDAVRVCQLEMDLPLLASGLGTEIGEKGINLSGGQRARVSLARAVYADRDLYLLDDPLSALDAHVGERVVSDVLLGCLAHKTRVLATHQLHVLSRADHIIVLSEGRVVFSGDYQMYLASPLSHVAQEEVNRQNQLQKETECREGVGEKEKVENGEGKENKEVVDDRLDDGPAAKNVQSGMEQQDDGAPGKLMTVEEKAVGSVPWSTYLKYFRSCGGIHTAVAVLLVFLLTELLTVSCSVWLSLWSTRRFDLPTNYYLGVYIALVILGTVTVPLRFSMAYSAMRRGSRNLHRLILRSVSVGTMRFFDTTPLGRIINRFSRDIDRIDDALQMTIIFLLQTAYTIFSSLAVAMESQPYILVVVIPIGYLYYRLIIFYNASNREIRRIGSTVKAPMLSLLGEALVGSSTIAAFKCAPSLMREALHRIDLAYAASLVENAANRWLGVRVDLISNVFVVMIAFFGVVGKVMQLGSHQIGLVSLSLTMALASASQLNWLVRQVGTVEADMNSVERIIYYTENIDHEDMPEISQLVDEIQNKKQSASDATTTVVIENDNDIRAGERNHVNNDVRAGWIEFRDVEVRYRPGLPLVLDKVNFRIGPREKVGIVGRTGSGKSTLLLTFMRMVDICGGDIIVCGRSIDTYRLRELRGLFSMIPQDPVLFDGTVRSNVDPFLAAGAAEVWTALELVGLRACVAAEAGGIDSRVREGGTNYSVGQRQLLCLARALLKRGSSFILMDEATANIDHALDRQIQHTVMTAFAEHTVITIAHRLHTVAPYDKIIVMDRGVVVEIGAPRDLIADTSSRFSAMVQALGSGGAAEFHSLLTSSPKPLP